MKPNPAHRLPAPLEAAVQRLKLAAREATERTIESLGLSALASVNTHQRDGLLGAQFELNRKSAVFALAFNDAFDDRLLRELSSRGAVSGAPAAPPDEPTSWDMLSLVADSEVEAQISAERFGMDIAHGCEWELRELDGYVGSLLGDGAHGERNPLRPALVGHALNRGIAAVSDRPEIRDVLAAELSRSLAAVLPAAYAAVVGELRHAGVQPMGLAVRATPSRVGGGGGSGGSGGGGTGSGGLSTPGAESGGSPVGSRGSPTTTTASGHRTSTLRSTGRADVSSTRGFDSTRSGSAPMGHVDPALMALLRRLAVSGSAGDGGDVGADAADGSGGDDGGDNGDAVHRGTRRLPNLIHAHRAELQRAAAGPVDHLVIDLIGLLFDQILADPTVSPQLARQIARLQLPVLRAALGDPGFFASRRHPVRRFVNRIAALGSAWDDPASAPARAFVERVGQLVDEVVEGDFDRIETYERQLAAIEAWTAEQASRSAATQGSAAALLAEKEDQLRLRQLYAQQLAGALRDLPVPAFLRDFVSHVWSQVLLRAAAVDGDDGMLLQDLRRTGRELVLSVQPKATPALRKAFLAGLPRLMQDVNAGMNLIDWPEADRREFFGRLMPAHGEALKGPAGRQLDINLMARQLDGALDRPLPSRAEAVAAAAALPVLTDEVVVPAFSADEAASVGLVDESTVDWNGQVDIDIDAPQPAPDSLTEIELPGLPSANDAPEAGAGETFADQVQLGSAYRMHLGERWLKVRLAHLNAGRSFFIFTHGARHQQTVSLTRRMLDRLAAGDRIKADAGASLLDRATARARRQLAALRSPPASRR